MTLPKGSAGCARSLQGEQPKAGLRTALFFVRTLPLRENIYSEPLFPSDPQILTYLTNHLNYQLKLPLEAARDSLKMVTNIHIPFPQRLTVPSDFSSAAGSGTPAIPGKT